MNTRHVVLLSHHDGSGAIQAFGPYATESLAQDAKASLQTWPALGNTGRWEVLPCVDIGQGHRPCPGSSGYVGPWEIGCSLPFGHAEPHDEERLTDTRTL